MGGVLGQRLARVLAPQRRKEDGARGEDQIIVSDTAYLSGRAQDLVAAVGAFVRFALDKALFSPGDISPSARASQSVATYAREVKAGGHSQYASTTGLDPERLASCQKALEAMQHGTMDLHRRFVQLAQDEPERMDKVRLSGGLRVLDPAMAELDCEFRLAELEFTLTEAHASWLRTLPELTVVPDHEYRAALNYFAGESGDAAARRARTHRATLESSTRDPVKQALSFLCGRAQEPRRFLAWHSGTPGSDLGDGVKIVRFVVETDKGMCSAFFHPRVSLLLDAERHDQPLARVPSELVISHVARHTGQSLMDVLGQ